MNNSLHIIHTIAGLRKDHGGTSRSVPNLCNHLCRGNVTVSLIAGKPHDASIASNVPHADVVMNWIPESMRHRQFGLYGRFAKRANEAILPRENDSKAIIHDHGLWLANNRAIAAVARHNSIVRVVSPRGMLSQWSMGHRAWKKKLAWLLYQRRDLASASAFHATGQQEAEDIRRLGFKQPIAIIPNGIDLPAKMPDRPPSNRPASEDRVCLFLSRIHPKKGLLNLLHAWHDTGLASKAWKIVIAGPDENSHQAEVEALAQSLGLSHRITFTGSLSDEEKWKWYRNADLFVLPSFSENFGIVVAESLVAGTPVITTTPTPWSALKENSIGWWVAPTVSGLSKALAEATELSDMQRSAMGERASQWASKPFGWVGIASKMVQFYEWLLNPESPKPDWVV